MLGKACARLVPSNRYAAWLYKRKVNAKFADCKYEWLDVLALQILLTWLLGLKGLNQRDVTICCS